MILASLPKSGVTMTLLLDGQSLVGAVNGVGSSAVHALARRQPPTAANSGTLVTTDFDRRNAMVAIRSRCDLVERQYSVDEHHRVVSAAISHATRARKHSKDFRATDVVAYRASADARSCLAVS